jgi:hypothetical protein
MILSGSSDYFQSLVRLNVSDDVAFSLGIRLLQSLAGPIASESHANSDSAQTEKTNSPSSSIFGACSICRVFSSSFGFHSPHLVSQLDGSIAIFHFVMKSQPYAELQQDEAEASNSAMSFRERGEHGSLMRPQHWKLTLLLFITAISLIINIIVFTKVATWSKSCSGNLLSQTAFFPHCE